MQSIRVLVMGGTIDNLEYHSLDDAPMHQHSVIGDLLAMAHVTCPVKIDVVTFKDSKFITEDDRMLLFQQCNGVPEERIIVTHGTTTMTETAKYLKKRMKKKTIVLTGAMVMPRESTSDAHFNLGYALCAAQHLPHGVYVAMNGTIFDARNVRKNVEEKIFEHKKPC